ncbi:MAG TPA: GNAT family N-acetyltransferase [Myxococcus sp.]|nr:GNAT family N-acetyltransferase [Myxococcus sp.]
MKPVIRIAGAADAKALAGLGAETFRDTFGHLYPAEDLTAFLEESHSPVAWSRLLASPEHRTWIAEVGAQPAAYAVAGPCKLPHPEVTAGSGEFQRIYVLRSHQGSGLGKVLFEEATAWLEAEGRRPIWIGVYSENHRAQKLYLSRGFTRVGEYEFPVGRTRDRELILRRA